MKLIIDHHLLHAWSNVSTPPIYLRVIHSEITCNEYSNQYNRQSYLHIWTNFCFLLWSIELYCSKEMLLSNEELPTSLHINKKWRQKKWLNHGPVSCFRQVDVSCNKYNILSCNLKNTTDEMVLSLRFTLHAQIQVQSIFYNFPYTRESVKIYFASYAVRASVYTVVRLVVIIN
jgi:hypothetical protein